MSFDGTGRVVGEVVTEMCEEFSKYKPSDIPLNGLNILESEFFDLYNSWVFNPEVQEPHINKFKADIRGIIVAVYREGVKHGRSKCALHSDN